MLQILQIPYLYFENEKKCSSNFMFLFYSGNHYELIRFKYFKQVVKNISNARKTILSVPVYYTIFKSNDLLENLPPLHMLFFIYGSVYQRLDEDKKQNFDVYNQIMSRFDGSFIKLQTNPRFMTKFTYYFPNAKPLKGGSETDIQGGAFVSPDYKPVPYYNPNPNPYNPNPYNPNPYNSYNPYNPYYENRYITKKPEDIGASKLAYTITIDMELYPGTSLTPSQISEMKCNNRYNAVRKAFASFTGRPYIIPPVYRTLPTSSDKTRRINEQNPNQQQIRRGGKTRKNYR